MQETHGFPFVSLVEVQKKAPRWERVSHDKVFYADVIRSLKFMISRGAQQRQKKTKTKFHERRIIFNFAHSTNFEKFYDKLFLCKYFFPQLCFVNIIFLFLFNTEGNNCTRFNDPLVQLIFETFWKIDRKVFRWFFIIFKGGT